MNIQISKIARSFVLLLLLGGIGFSASAQSDFQGTLKYSFKYMGEGADQMGAFMPESYTINIRKSDMRFQLEGGMLSQIMGCMIFKPKKGTMYLIQESAQKVLKMPLDSDADKAELGEPEITKMEETIKIAGYECQKYKVVQNVMGNEVVTSVWVTDQFQLPEESASKNQMTSSLRVEGIPGLVMKKMTVMSGMGLDITTIETATEVSTEKPGKDLFKVPKDYEMEETTMEEFQSGMMNMGG